MNKDDVKKLYGLIMSPQGWEMIKSQSTVLHRSGFYTGKSPEAIATIILQGMELGIPPIEALNGINIIKGKPSISPELMLSLIYKNNPTAEIKFLELSTMACIISARRNEKSDFETFSFTIEDAKTAELLGKENWKKYPRAMLRSRCVSEMARSLFPDAIRGVSYTPEELGEQVEDCNIKLPEIETKHIEYQYTELQKKYGIYTPKELLKHVEANGLDIGVIKNILKEDFGGKSSSQLTHEEFSKLVEMIIATIEHISPKIKVVEDYGVVEDD